MDILKVQGAVHQTFRLKCYNYVSCVSREKVITVIFYMFLNQAQAPAGSMSDNMSGSMPGSMSGNMSGNMSPYTTLLSSSISTFYRLWYPRSFVLCLITSIR